MRNRLQRESRKDVAQQPQTTNNVLCEVIIAAIALINVGELSSVWVGDGANEKQTALLAPGRTLGLRR